MTNKKIFNMLAFLMSCLFLLFFLHELWGFYHDDAYIVLRYAKNFLDGKGVVWNAGEKVEGYSCFLWLMLISLLGYFHMDLVLASRILGICFAFFTLLLAFGIKRDEKVPLAGLLLSTNSCFVLWSLGGLETVAFGFFVLLGVAVYLKRNRHFKWVFLNGLIFSLSAMTRPEGLLFFGLTFIFMLFEQKKLSRLNIQNTLSFISGFLVLSLPYFLWRIVYYGHLFPCTFYVKGGTNIFKILFGGRYVLDFFTIFGFPLLIILFVKGLKNFFFETSYLLCLLVSYILYVFVIGGDHMQGFRFFIPILPLFYLFVQMAFYKTKLSSTFIKSFLSITVIIGTNFFISKAIILSPESTREVTKHSYQYRTCFKVPDPAAYIGKFIGFYIKKNWPHDSTVALNTAGSTPYFSEISSCIDMLGLNDYTIAKRKIHYDVNFLKDITELKLLFQPGGRTEIMKKIFSAYLPWQLRPGHGKGDGQYVLSRKPDYIIIGPVNGTAKMPWFLGDKEILSSPEFHKTYQLEQVPIKVADPFSSFYELTKSGSLVFTYYQRKKGANENF